MNTYELYRRMANLSQKEAAEKIGVNQSAVSQWETGQTTPRTSLLSKVASVYNTTVDALLSSKVGD